MNHLKCWVHWLILDTKYNEINWSFFQENGKKKEDNPVQRTVNNENQVEKCSNCLSDIADGINFRIQVQQLPIKKKKKYFKDS